MKWSDPGVFGVAFLKNLRDVLWYIDGHHDTIAAKVHPVPQVFAKFNGYNCPQVHKHRKCTKGNLTCSEISRHSLVLQDNLQASWFKKDCYKALRDATEDLMGSLSSYAAYLKKSKSQKVHHQSDTPSVTPSDSSHLEYLSKITQRPTSLGPIEDELKVKEPYIPVAVGDFAPSDRKQRYRCVLYSPPPSLCVCVCLSLFLCVCLCGCVPLSHVCEVLDI